MDRARVQAAEQGMGGGPFFLSDYMQTSAHGLPGAAVRTQR